MSSGGETSGGGGGSLGAGLGGGLGSGSNPSEKDKNDALYEDREPKKIIRIITVMAYMFSVSFVGITLSAYYIFLWHPPNPRLMHAQTMSIHSEARVNFLSDEAVELAKNAKPAALGARGLDFFGAQPESDVLKTRREIVKNVNAILRANFEKTRTSEMPILAVTKDIGLQLVNHTDNANSTTPSLNNIAKSSTFRASDSLTIEPTEQLSSISPNMDDPTINTRISTESTVTPTTISQIRRTKSPSKKQHQTPFALKHLEVPIKSDGPRRRSTQLGDKITTTSSSNIPLSTRGDPSAAMQIPRKMSAHNVMASISRTLGTRHGEGKPANEVKFAGEESKDKLYEPKHKQKLVRVFTVVAYIISVSLAAIVLSLYYMYIWDPSDHPHYANKQKINLTTTAATPISTAKTPCLDLTPAIANELTSPLTDGNSYDKSTPSSLSTESSRTFDTTNPQQIMKSLYRTLITPSADLREADYSSSTNMPLPMPSISSDQFQAIPHSSVDDYHDSTIQPVVDDLMEDHGLDD